MTCPRCVVLEERLASVRGELAATRDELRRAYRRLAALGNEPIHPQHVITVKRDEDDAA